MVSDPLFVNSQRYSHDLFLKDDWEEVTYGQAETRVAHWAGAWYRLLTNIPQKVTYPNSITVALLLNSGIDHGLMVLAGYRLRLSRNLDLRILPLNFHKPIQVLEEEMERAGTNFLLYDPALIDIGETNYFKEAGSVYSLNAFKKIASEETEPLTPINNGADQGSPFIYLFTSGSSGRSKLAVFSWENWMRSADYGDRFFPFRRGDRWLHLLPFYHVSGMSILFRALLHAATVVFTEKHRNYWPVLIESHSLTHISIVPAQLNIQKTPEPKPNAMEDPLKYLKLIKMGLIGGGPIPEFVRPYLYPHTPLRPTYGLTESIAHVAIYDGVKNEECFPLKILPPRRIKVVNGEIFIHKDTLFLGYLEENKIEEPWDEGWFATGDVGEMEGDHLIVKGRKDRQFISGGENIHPEEIERVILAYPGTSRIDQACVFPIPHERWGLVPGVAIKVDGHNGKKRWEASSINSLNHYLHQHLETYKIPRKFFLLPESFSPITSINKGVDGGIKLSYRAIEEAYHRGELSSLS